MRWTSMRQRKRLIPAGLAVAALGAVGVLASTTLAGAATSAQPGPVFRPGGSYEVGSTPVDSVAADFDGDGDRDLAVANEDSENVSVLLNNGDGTFGQARNYRVLAKFFEDKGATGIVAADFNEDGVLDLATANPVFGPGQVSILIGNGDGTFQSFYHLFQYGIGVGPAVGLTAGDFNGDGHVDLVVPLSFDSVLVTALGNGDGTFQVVARNILEGRPAQVMSADLNGDGILDVVVLGEGRAGDYLLPLLGNGDGSFRPAKGRQTPAVDKAYVVELCHAPDQNQRSRDFNGDRIPDIAVVDHCSPGRIRIFLGNGDGTFTRGKSYSTQAAPTSVASADFNGDGISDLAASKTTRARGKVSVLAGAGDGTFQKLTQPPSYRVGPNPLRVTAADLNGDRRPDLVVANAGEANSSDVNTVTVLLNTGDRAEAQG